VACDDGATLAREQTQAPDKEHVLEALGKAATAMRARLGESMTSIQKLNAPLEKITTSSLDALQEFSRGIRLQYQGQFLAAIPHFEQAVNIDPNFAWAYHTLSVAYSNAGDRERVKRYATRAFELAGRASEFERLVIQARYYWQVTGEVEKAVSTYEAEARDFPRDWSGHSEMSFLLRNIGEFEKAASEGEQAVALGPKMEPAHRNLIRAYLSLDRFSDAKEACVKARAQGLDGPVLHARCLEVALGGGDKPTVQNRTKKKFNGSKLSRRSILRWNSRRARRTRAVNGTRLSSFISEPRLSRFAASCRMLQRDSTMRMRLRPRPWASAKRRAA